MMYRQSSDEESAENLSSDYESSYNLSVDKAPKVRITPSNKRASQAAVRQYAAQQFEIRIPTRYPKCDSDPHLSNQIVKVLGLTKAPMKKYFVQWQDKTRSFVNKDYLQQHHKQILHQFEVRNSFHKYIQQESPKQPTATVHILID